VPATASPLIALRNTERKTLRLVGFKVLLGWHYLVLFSPLLIGSMEHDTSGFFFQRQLTLYLTLFFSFVVLMAIGKHILVGYRKPSSTALLIAMGLLAMAATLLSVITIWYGDGLLALRFVSVVLLGVSEAFLMYLWLHFYASMAMDYLHRSLAVDMVWGALIGFVVSSLQAPVSFILVIAMPGIATVSLLINWFSVKEARAPQPPCDTDQVKKGVHRRFLKNSVPSFIYAFVFGLLQGSFIEGQVTFMMASDPLILLGIIIAGIIIYLIPESPNSHADIDLMHRFSLLFFVLGVLGLTTLVGATWLVLGETAILAGFNLFDFGALALSIGMTRRLRLKSSSFIDGGRALVYLSFAIGLATGNSTMILSGIYDVAGLLYAISGLAIALLIFTVLTPLRDNDGEEVLEAATVSDGTASARPLECSAKDGLSPQKKEPSSSMRPWRRICEEVAETYHLSRRELEVFILIAKGRNAEYIQKELYISHHTAKTHIANIYHKLDVHSNQEMLDLIESFRSKKDD